MNYLSEPDPPRHVAVEILPGIRRLVAANPGPMTYHGTNTYLIDSPDGIIVLDPGPDGQPAHVDDVLRGAGGPIAAILLSHRHHDHHGLLAPLQAASGAPSWGFAPATATAVQTDHVLADGDKVAGLTALHTPGHAGDHLCFAMPGGILFSADHVMGWSTSVVIPPDGNMAAYFRSLERLIERDDQVYLPGHGPPLRDPMPHTRFLLRHRQQREAAILAALTRGAWTASQLTSAVYGALDPALHPAAQRNVLAHLLKLQAEGRAAVDGPLWYTSG